MADEILDNIQTEDVAPDSPMQPDPEETDIMPLDTLEAYVCFASNTLTFYYDTDRGTRSGTIYTMNSGTYRPAWYNKKSSIYYVVFDESFKDYKPTTCHEWFRDDTYLHSITNLDYLDTSEAESLYCMFYNCNNLTSIDVSHFNTSKAYQCNWMFCFCWKLQSLNLKSFDTSNITNMSNMLRELKLVTSLDLSSFDTSKVSSMSNIFNGNTNLSRIYVSNKFTISSDTNIEAMFVNNTKLPNFNSSKVDGTMAKSVNDGGYLINKDELSMYKKDKKVTNIYKGSNQIKELWVGNKIRWCS